MDVSDDERGIVAVAQKTKRMRSDPSNSGGVSVVMSESHHRTVYDHSTRESLREALRQSLEATKTGEAPIRDWLIDDIDPETQREQDIDHEVERLMDLKSYMILDTVRTDPRDTPFDQLAEMAGRMFDNRFICVITVVDLGRQYFLSYTPVISRVIPRVTGFCSHTLQHRGDILVVPDCHQDKRFCHNPFVMDNLRMSFYAGAPMISKQGYRLGAFCLADIKPHPEGLTAKETQTLKDFAKLAMEAIEKNRIVQMQQIQLKQASRALASAAHDLLTPLTGIQLSTTLLSEDPDFTRKLRNGERECLRTAGSCVDTMVGICGSLRNTEQALLLGGPPQKHANAIPLLMDDPKRPSASSSSAFNIHDTVERLHQVMNACPKKVPLHVVLDPSVPSLVIGNELTIFRAALNLLNVSSHRTISGFVRFTVRAATNQNGGDRQLVFECEDTGPVAAQSTSISAQLQFLTNTDQGTSSFYHLINHLENLGTKLSVTPKTCTSDSCKPPTTCMTFCLPLVVPESGANLITDSERISSSGQLKLDTTEDSTATEAGSTKSDASLEPEIRRRHVLIVDDSPVIRKMIARVLSRIGIDTTMACNGMEGLQMMKENTYDFVLLDFLM